MAAAAERRGGKRVDSVRCPSLLLPSLLCSALLLSRILLSAHPPLPQPLSSNPCIQVRCVGGLLRCAHWQQSCWDRRSIAMRAECAAQLSRHALSSACYCFRQTESPATRLAHSLLYPLLPSLPCSPLFAACRPKCEGHTDTAAQPRLPSSPLLSRSIPKAVEADSSHETSTRR